jgi:hypothetical protein
MHKCPFANLLYSFNYDALAGMKAFPDDPLRSDPLSDAHRLDIDLAVRIHYRNLKTPLQFRHSFLRDEQCSTGQLEFHPNAAKLARPKR